MSTESNQCRDDLRLFVGELALGDDAWLSDDERRVAQAHVAECGACRAYMADVAAIGDVLRWMAEPEPVIGVPERVQLESRYRILAAVRVKAVEFRQQELEAAWRRRARLWWAASAAVAVLVLGLGLWYWLSRPEQIQVARTPANDSSPLADAARPQGDVTFAEVGEAVQQPVDRPTQSKPRRPTLRETFADADDPREALGLLRGEFEKAKGAPKDSRETLEEVLAGAEGIMAKWPESDQRLEALSLISRCHTQLADPKKAQEAFLEYAERLGAKAKAKALEAGLTEAEAEAKGQEATAIAIIREATRRFGKKDYVAAVSYCDVLLTRYPGTEPALQGQVMFAEYHLRVRQPAQAADTLQAVIREAPNSGAAMSARASLPSALFNAGRRADGVQAWLDFAKACSSSNGKASGYCNAGMLLLARGKRHHPQAIKMFRTVVQKYPDSNHAPLAKRKLMSLQKEIEDEVLDLAPRS